MVDQIDFLAFYQQLGLKPGCTLDELKVAYRRRVAVLHPDRRGDAPPDTSDAADLQHLIATYNAATAFERRYGRLPGGQHVATPRPMPSANRGMPASRPATHSPRSGARRAVMWLAATAGVAWLAWSLGFAGPDGESAHMTPAQAISHPTGALVASGVPSQLEIGMDADTVRALEGRPTMEDLMHWDYGPSWVEFSDSKVTGWYSSRLRPLKVASARPPPREAKAH